MSSSEWEEGTGYDGLPVFWTPRGVYRLSVWPRSNEPDDGWDWLIHHIDCGEDVYSGHSDDEWSAYADVEAAYREYVDEFGED
ncbi:hypothetical protein [Azospirillum sp. Marseille-Q6669]